MAPGGKKQPKGRAAKAKAKAKAKAAEKVPRSTLPYVSEKEKSLQKEYATLTEHIKSYTERVCHFQWENEFLDKEAQQVRDTSKVYLSYLTRRSIRCQNAIISLNDQNRWDLEQIRKQKAELVTQYGEKERQVSDELLQMETKLSLVTKEIETLRPWQELQQEQLARIRELEKELLAMKVHHSEQMHKVKSQFLQLAAEYEMEAQQKLQALAKLAEKEAVRCLIEYTKQIKADNWRLHHELVALIKRAQVLKALVAQLRAQRLQLLREHQYRHDLARRHSWLRHLAGARRGIAPGSKCFRCRPSTRARLLSPRATSEEPLAPKDQASCCASQPHDMPEGTPGKERGCCTRPCSSLRLEAAQAQPSATEAKR